MINQLSFDRELRLLTPRHFNHVFSQSVRVGSPYITFVFRNNHVDHPRLGFAIAKKQVKRAHERNRLKRVIREDFRLRQNQIPAVDIIVMARTAAVALDNKEIRTILDKLWQRLLSGQKNKN